jgi:hypothetical protein
VVDLTPLSADGSQLEALRTSFAGFINALLNAERAAEGMPGDHLVITSRENDPDGGVDALFIDAPGSTWVPVGTSAWQFKRSEITTDQCREEVAKPEVTSVIAAGGGYGLALGADSTPRKIRFRRGILVEAVGDSSRVRVINASALAAWASSFPSVLAYPPLRASIGPLITHQQWSEKERHRSPWYPDAARTRIITAARAQLRDPATTSMRFEGPGGVGKTRLVLEILRDEELAPLCVYVDDADDLDGTFFNLLLAKDRRMIVVVDECDRRQHAILCGRLLGDGRVQLITIGPSSELDPWLPAFYEVPTMDAGDLAALVRQSFPRIPSHHAEFAAGNAGGSVRYALHLANQMTLVGEAEASRLIQAGDIETLLHVSIPAGDTLFFATGIALMRRIGWDEPFDADLIALGMFLGMDLATMRRHAESLLDAGLLVRQGRYRYLSPHPLAIHLAATRWSRDQDRIVRELLPSLSADGVDSLLARAADLGWHVAVQGSIASLITPEGPFGSLDVLEEDDRARLLNYLSVIEPARTLSLLERITALSPELLTLYTRSRRQLVWSLEKLAWHSETFERAADVLFRLAEAENETFGNNATGTWAALFAARLPATAASPDARLAYLVERALRASTPAHQSLVLSAAASGVSVFESRTVSAEHQYGHAVEPAGSPSSWEEERRYRLGMMGILGELAAQANDPELRQRATTSLLESLPPYARTDLANDLLDIVLPLVPSRVARQHAMRWLRVSESGQPALHALANRVIELTTSSDPFELLIDLLENTTWIADPAAELRISEQLVSVREAGEVPAFLDWASTSSAPSIWIACRAAAAIGLGNDLLDRLMDASTPQVPALGGCLAGLVSGSIPWNEAVIRIRSRLEPAACINVVMADDPSEVAISIVGDIMAQHEVPLHLLATMQIRRWLVRLETVPARLLLRTVTTVLESPADISCLADLTLGFAQAFPTDLVEVEDLAWLVVTRLSELGDVYPRWEGLQIARLLVPSDPVRVFSEVLRGMRHRPFNLNDDDAQVLRASVELEPSRCWEAGIALLQDSPTTTFYAQGWFAELFPPAAILDWTSGDIDRARLVASLVQIGDSRPSQLVRSLLDAFGDDESVSDSLAMGFMTGFWTGPESLHLQEKIDQVASWNDTPALRRWSSAVTDYLSRRLTQARISEEERGW